MMKKIEMPSNGNLLEALSDVILENKTMTLEVQTTEDEWIEIEIMSMDEYAQRGK